MKRPGIDTIAAVATPPGAGGIGIVRISGPGAVAVAQLVFRCRGGRPLSEAPPHRLRLGTTVDPRSGEPIDEALAVWMPEGRSYTGESTVEIHAHGGRAVLEALVRAAVAAGARPAAPGEFTKRAYLNGRLDLAQAEAVAGLIGAESEEDRRSALRQLQGGLSVKIRQFRGRLLDLAAGTEALLDFGDEEGEGAEPVAAEIAALAEEIRGLASDGRGSHLRRRGVRAVIAGRPNSGKSSLFNKLLEMERSIVTPLPGTTRDYVEETAVIGGVAISLVDTAGVRQSADPIELEGVARTLRLLRDSEVVVVVIDGAMPLDPEDLLLIETARDKLPTVAVNKIDLPPRLDPDDLARRVSGVPVFGVSALTGEGLDAFSALLSGRCREALPAPPPSGLAPNPRQCDALERAATALDAARDAVSRDGPLLDQAAADFRGGLAALDEITGENAGEEIVERIFGRFCIGK